MSVTTNNRALSLKNEMKGKSQFTFNQGILQSSAWVVLKGAPNKKNAMRYINSILKPKRQASFCESLNLGPVNPRAFEYMSKEFRDNSPSDCRNREIQLDVSVDWYVKNYDRVLENYLTFISGLK